MKTGIAFALLILTSASIQAEELKFLTNYGESLQRARSSARPLLVVLSRDEGLPTTGNTETATEGDQLSHYVLCKIDASSEYGKRVAAAFRVTEFPHSVIIDKSGKTVLYSKAGSFSNQTWSAMLTKYQGGQASAADRQVAVRETQARETTQFEQQSYSQGYPSYQGSQVNFGRQSYFGGQSFSGRGRAYCST